MAKKNYNTKEQPTKQTKGQNKNITKQVEKIPVVTKPQKPSLSLITTWMMLLVIVIMTFIAYSPSMKNELTNWDDKAYVEENTMLSEWHVEDFKSMFFGSHKYFMGNYHPLSIFSLSVDYHLGDNKTVKQFAAKLRGDKPTEKPRAIDPFIFHLMNVLFHLLNTILVFWFIYYLLKKFDIAIIGALLFGLSTIHVESVTWVSERKDVLHTFFFLISLIMYLKYIDTSKWKFYILSIIIFFLSIISKGQAVSLSVTLVAIDWLYGRKLLSRKVILEKVPFFVLSIVFGIIAILAQKAGAAIHEITEYPLYMRILFASYGITQYVGKLTIPYNLAAIYPYPRAIQDIYPYQYLYYILPAIIFPLLAYWAYKKNKIVTFGFAFFIINIFLVLQLLPVGSAIMADRYSYIPSVGYFIIFAYGFKYLIDKKPNFKIPAYILLGVYAIYLSVATFNQTQIWKDSTTLWTHTLEINEDALVGWNNLGSAHDKDNLKERAIYDFTRAIALKPDYTHAYYNRGTSRKDLNLYKDAIMDFNKAIEIDPSFAEAYHNRGICKETLGDLKGALADYNKGLSLTQIPNMYSSRGVCKGKMGNLKDAIDDFNTAIRLKPDNPEAYSNRGLANDHAGNLQQAIADYTTSINLNPRFATAWANRGITKHRLKDNNGAVSDYTTAIMLDPKFVDSYYNRAYVYWEMKNYAAACTDIQMARKLGMQISDAEVAKFCK